MPSLAIFLIFGTVWAALIVLGRVLPRNPRGDLVTGMLYLLILAYCRVFHRVRVTGRENIPSFPVGGKLNGNDGPTPIIIVANHTAGVDPAILQYALPFYVRWMMAADMMLPALNAVWEWGGMISVARGGKETASARQAIRAIENGAALGIFPEGSIERPPGRLLPFVPGVGLIIARTKAPVLPMVIDGTPYSNSAWGSLFKCSRSRVRIMPVIEYATLGLRPDAIAADLQRRYEAWTGWPVGPRTEIPAKPVPDRDETSD